MKFFRHKVLDNFVNEAIRNYKNLDSEVHVD